jgi:rSAM/selenodomain-associated transferase 2
MKISVVIPVFNEAASIRATLDALHRNEEIHEVIVVDGASTDATVAIARECGVRVTSGPRGRGSQLAVGANAATGDVIWFLHGDTLPAEAATAAIRRALADGDVVGGNFRLVFDGDTRAARFMTWIYPQFRKLGLLYGDSAIFVRRDKYHECGGFRDWPLFEDLEFIQRLRRKGRLVHLTEEVMTSSRRFEGRPFLPVFLRWIIFQGLYWFGVSPHFLARHYLPVRK